MIEDGADGPLPVVIEDLSVQTSRAALAGAVEGDHVEARAGEQPPDGEELLDEGVEAAKQQHRAARARGAGAQHRRRQRAVAVGDGVAGDALARERLIKQREEPLVGGAPLGGVVRREELGRAHVERGVLEPALGLRAVGLGVELAHVVGEGAHVAGRRLQILEAREALGVDPVQLVVDERVAVQAVDADRQRRRVVGEELGAVLGRLHAN